MLQKVRFLEKINKTLFQLKILNVGKKSIRMGLNSSADVVEPWPQVFWVAQSDLWSEYENSK